jgi:hypothetical protein
MTRDVSGFPLIRVDPNKGRTGLFSVIGPRFIEYTHKYAYDLGWECLLSILEEGTANAFFQFYGDEPWHEYDDELWKMVA